MAVFHKKCLETTKDVQTGLADQVNPNNPAKRKAEVLTPRLTNISENFHVYNAWNKIYSLTLNRFLSCVTMSLV